MEIDSKYHIPDEHKKVLKMLLEKTSEAMDSLKITYFIDGGTLLGAVRHKDLIPYDDDIDIGTFYPDFPKLAMLLSQQIKAHEKYEIKIQQSDVMIKVYVSDMWEQSKDGKIIGTPTLDIFRWETKNNKIRLYSFEDRQRFPNCFYKKDEFFPLQNS